MNIVARDAKVKSHAVNFFPLDEAERKNFDKQERLSGIYAFLSPFGDAEDGQPLTTDPVTQAGLDRMSDMNDALRQFVCGVHQPSGGEIQAGDEINFMSPAPATKRQALVERYVSLNETMRSVIPIQIPGAVDLAFIRRAAPNLVVWRLDQNPHLQPGNLRPGDTVDQMDGDTHIIEPVLIFNLRDSVCFTAAGKPGPKRLYDRTIKALCRELGGIHIEGMSLNPCSPLNGWLKLRSERYSLKELAPARTAAQVQFTGPKWADPIARETWEKATSLVREYYRAGRWPDQRADFIFEVSEWVHSRIGDEFEDWRVEKLAERVWQNFDPQKAFGGIRRGRDRDVVGDTRTKQSIAGERTNVQQLSQTAEKIKAAITAYRRRESRMPSVRRLAEEAGVSPGTVQRHLQALRADPDWRASEFDRMRLHIKCFWKEHLRRPTAKEISAATGHAASFVDEFFTARGPDPELDPAVPIRCCYSDSYNNIFNVDEIDRPVAAIDDTARRRVDPDPGREMRLIDREKTRQGVEDYILGQLHRGAASSLELRAPAGLRTPENLAWWLDSAASAPRRPEQTGDPWPDRPKRGRTGYIYVDWRGSPTREINEQDDLFSHQSPDDELRREFVQGLQSKRARRQVFSTSVLIAAARRGISSDQLFDAVEGSFADFLVTAQVRTENGRIPYYSDLFLDHVETMPPLPKTEPSTSVSAAETQQILGRFELYKEEADIMARELVKLCGPGVDKAWASEIKAGRRRPTRSPALDYALFAAECLRRPPAGMDFA